MEGLGLRGPREKGSPSVSRGPNPPLQLLQLLKNSPREVKWSIFVIYWSPPVPPRKWNWWGSEGKVPPGPPPPVSPAMIRLYSVCRKLLTSPVGTSQASRSLHIMLCRRTGMHCGPAYISRLLPPCAIPLSRTKSVRKPGSYRSQERSQSMNHTVMFAAKSLDAKKNHYPIS